MRGGEGEAQPAHTGQAIPASERGGEGGGKQTCRRRRVKSASAARCFRNVPHGHRASPRTAQIQGAFAAHKAGARGGVRMWFAWYRSVAQVFFAKGPFVCVPCYAYLPH